MITIDTVDPRGETPRPVDMRGDSVREWGSIAEVHHWLENEGQYDTVRKNKECAASTTTMTSSGKEQGGMSWDLNAGWAKAYQLSYEGWEEGADKLRAALDKLEDFSPASSLESEAEGIDLIQSDEGEMFMPDEYFAGEENFMMDVRFKTHKPIIRICCNISASCGVSADDMIARGVVIAATCRKLERLGYGVQVWVADAGRGSHGVSVNLVRIKDSDQYMDDRALAFWMGHPAALRRIFFRFIEATPVRVGIGCNYGTPANFTSSDFDMISPSAHLDAARAERWLNDPAAAAAASERFINSILSGVKEVGDEEA